MVERLLSSWRPPHELGAPYGFRHPSGAPHREGVTLSAPAASAGKAWVSSLLRLPTPNTETPCHREFISVYPALKGEASSGGEIFSRYDDV